LAKLRRALNKKETPAVAKTSSNLTAGPFNRYRRV
jgi:hypothetical protein